MPRGASLGANLAALAAITDVGMLAHTSATTWAVREITGTADQITVSHGDGVADPPTISLPATIQVDGVSARTDSLTLTIGTDAGDDCIIGNNSTLVVEGDNDRVGILTAAPATALDVAGTITCTTLDLSEGDLENGGVLNCDSVISDGTTLTFGGTPSIVLTDDTTIAITLDTDSGDDLLIGATMLVVEGDTGNVGINTADPEAGFHYDGATAAFSNGSSFPVINLHRIDSTIGNGHSLGQITFSGDDASAADTSGATIIANADAAWSSGSTPSRIRFMTVPASSETLVERVRIHSTGDVGIGTTAVPSANGGKTLLFGDNATDPTMAAETAGIYARDVSAVIEMFAIDEAGNASQLTTHHEDTGEVVHRSVNYFTGRTMVIYHERVARVVEQIAASLGIAHDPVIEIGTLPVAERWDWDAVQEANATRRLEELEAWERLASEDQAASPKPPPYVTRARPAYV